MRARGDATGNEMVRALMALCRAGSRAFNDWIGDFTVDLVVVEGRCCGAIVLDEIIGERTLFLPEPWCCPPVAPGRFTRGRRIRAMRRAMVWRWRFGPERC